jgi:hypothetical protein
MVNIQPGMTVLVTDAFDIEHLALVTYGPARDRNGIRGSFLKVWVRIDGEGEEIPWPIESVRLESA